jgi:hypothetical protein
VPKHWAIDLLQHVEPNLDFQVWSDAKDVGVEGGVMEFAERQSVSDDWLSSWMPVWQNVRRIE